MSLPRIGITAGDPAGIGPEIARKAMGLAWLMAASLSAAHIRLAIGVIAAAFVLRYWLTRTFERYTLKPGTTTGVIFGVIGGITTMLANAGGPAWQMHLLPQRLDKLSYVGTISVLFAASNLIKVPGYATLGFVTPENMVPEKSRRL